MKKKIIALILALTVILCAFTACGGSADSGFFTSFETETLDGEKASEEIFKGNRLTMVNIWGTFCGPCINEMPDLGRISEEYKDRGLKIVGVICDSYNPYTKENDSIIVQDARDIVKQTGAWYTHLLPSASLNSAILDSVFSYPTTYFLDENGEIIGSEYVGARSYEQWCEIIDTMLIG
jgi:thiol-disulfide isomerase/thioredoxin